MLTTTSEGIPSHTFNSVRPGDIKYVDIDGDGSITNKDEVVTSAYAKSMGGSQVYLEEGEKQTVDTLIKCIMVTAFNNFTVFQNHNCI